MAIDEFLNCSPMLLSSSILLSTSLLSSSSKIEMFLFFFSLLYFSMDGME